MLADAVRSEQHDQRSTLLDKCRGEKPLGMDAETRGDAG
jgi:hypothetical protein